MPRKLASENVVCLCRLLNILANFSNLFLLKMAKLFANSGDPDQTLHSAASDLGLHCLPVTHLGVSRLQWVNCHSLFVNKITILLSEVLQIIVFI